MHRRDRLASFALLAAAALAWVGVGFVFLNFDPRGDASALLAGGLLLGAAVALSLAPIFWLAAFARARRIAFRGDWWRAGRRALLVGMVTTLFVVLRGQGALSLPLASFVMAMAVLMEISLSLRR